MLLTAVQGANLGVRFVLELLALVALGYWGFHLNAPVPARVLAGIGAPLAAAVLWGLFASPRAAVALPTLGKAAVQVLVFAAAVAALAAAGRWMWTAVFGAVAAVNAALLLWWQQ